MAKVTLLASPYLRRMNTRHLKPGDITICLLAGTIPMPMRVLRVDRDVIYCGPGQATAALATPRGYVWTFDRATGAEIDDDLCWGPRYGITGSFLVFDDDQRGA